MQSHFPLGASTSPTHSKRTHFIGQPESEPPKVTRIHSQQWFPYHRTSVWLTSVFLYWAASRAPACRRFFTESRCVTHISASSLLRRVCFGSSSTSSEFKFRLCFWAFSKLFLDNSTRREVWAAGKSLLSVAYTFSRCIKCPMQSIDLATNFSISLFQPQSNLPDSWSPFYIPFIKDPVLPIEHCTLQSLGFCLWQEQNSLITMDASLLWKPKQQQEARKA